jgi:hypothetical protein
MNNKKPKGFENDLSNYGPQLFDSHCSKPVMWGFEILNHLGEERWAELRNFGEMECSYPNWFLITKKLTREEAVKLYGEITNEEYGPKGGWKSVTFGKEKFISKVLKPLKRY